MSAVDDFYVWLDAELKDIEENGPRVRRGRKPSKKQYFTYITDKAIIAYNIEPSWAKRNKVFREHINYPFNKLVENIYYTFRFSYFDVPYEDIKSEVVAFLVEKIGKFKEGKGKAFSYFSIVAKNYLIIQNNANYAKLKAKRDVTVIDKVRNITGEESRADYQDGLRDFTNLWCEWYDENLNKIFTNKRDIIVADTILELFRIRENIENFNKKALYILIRERTGLKTQNITKVANVMKKDYAKMYSVYNKAGRFKSTFNIND
ncbi:MAG: hypothetical protein H8E55_60075 [Pelagibacterales bacterium]|nr:hypothetical protein [Pelagibacterales bacterium]